MIAFFLPLILFLSERLLLAAAFGRGHVSSLRHLSKSPQHLFYSSASSSSATTNSAQTSTGALLVTDSDSNNGSIVQFAESVQVAITEQRLHNFTLTSVKTPTREEYKDLKSLSGRYIKLKTGMKVQLTYRYKTNDQFKNYDFSQVGGIIQKALETGCFAKAVSHTDMEMCEYSTGKKGGFKKTVRRESFSSSSSSDSKGEASPPPLPTPPSPPILALEHDRQKLKRIDINEPFLKALRITTTESEATEESPDSKSKRNKQLKGSTGNGSARARVGMTDKLRQIEKFVEILDGLVTKAFAADIKNLRIVDMGCGMGYLTFAVHRFFSEKYGDR